MIPKPATVDGPATSVIAHRVEESCLSESPCTPRKALQVALARTPAAVAFRFSVGTDLINSLLE